MDGGLELRVAVLLGLLVFAVPLAALGLLARPEPEPPVPWPRVGERPVAVAPDPRWSAADRESLAKLREVTLAQTARVLGELAGCEARAGRRATPSRAYRRCATSALAWTDGFASANGRMLAQLATTAGATKACRGRMLQLSGTSSNLAHVAQTTLRAGLDVPWPELLATSRTIRALAREARALARAPGWGRTCRPRPPARAAPAISKVA
jgi:hypothetical protein